MDSKSFQACLDTLATYSHIYAELSNAVFPQTEENLTISQLEDLIADLVEQLSKHKGQVA